MLIKIEKIEEVGTRLDKILFNYTDEEEGLSRTRIQQLVETGNLLKNNQIFTDNSYKVQLNDELLLSIPEPKNSNLLAKNIELNIVYEDKDLLVVNKQAGLTTHPGAGNYDNTLVNALLYHCKDNLSSVGGVYRAGIVHRLDKDTSGLMVVAKNDYAHIDLSRQIQTRTLKRIYNAVVWGNIIPESGQIIGYIARSRKNRLKMELVGENSGRYSLTNYKKLQNYNNVANLIECKLDTGRTHQIRLHMSSIKHPLIGDQLYGGNARKIKSGFSKDENFVNNFPRQALHSKSIKFTHPTTKEILAFDSELPTDMQELIKKIY